MRLPSPLSSAVSIASALALYVTMSPAAVPASAAQMAPPTTLGGWHDLGRANTSTRVDIAVVLKFHDDAQLEALTESQADESSPQYHHFLSPQQFARYFGPTPAEYNDTIAKLRQAGFTVTHTYPNRTLVDASAPAPVAGRFFGTQIDLIRREDGKVRYANTRPETIPASLSREVLTVVGLDNARIMRPQYVRLPAGAPRPAHTNMRVNGSPLFGPDGGYGPQVYLTSYNFPAGMDGTGRNSGIVGDADYLDSDLSAYLSFFGVTHTGTINRVLVDGGPPPGLSGDSLEATLDIETIASLVPGSNIYMYEAPSEPDLRRFADMYNQVVSDNKVDTVNTSYSECETAFVPGFPRAANHIEKEGNALGITFHASTGDNGTETYGCSGQVTVGSPTDTSHNVAIGGTIEHVDRTTGQETSEVGWNDQSGATGGGVSGIFRVSGYQKHISTVITTGRNIPDISFDASPFTGESLYFDGSFDGPIGGTSLSSPIFGAGLTAIDEFKGSRAGYFNKALYKTWKADGYSQGSTTYFRDIVSGSIPPYSAGPGYDQMSGIGAMLFSNFGSILP